MNNTPDNITLTLGKLTIRRRRLLGTVYYEFRDAQGVERKLVDELGNVARMIEASIEGSGAKLDHEPRPAFDAKPLQQDPRNMPAGPGLGPQNRLDNTRPT